MEKLIRKYLVGKIIFLIFAFISGSSLICVLGLPPAAQAEKLTIGVLLGLTGRTAAFGKQAQREKNQKDADDESV